MLSIYTLVVSAHLSGRQSYRGLTSHFCSTRVLPRLADLTSLLYALAMIVLHLTVARDVLPFLFQQWARNSTLSSFFLLPIFSALLLVPISLLFTRMSQLVVPSLVAIVCALYLWASLVYAYATSTLNGASGPIDMEPVLLFRWDYRLLQALAIFVFVLTPQLVFFPVVRSLKLGIERELSLRVTLVASGIGGAIYMLVGLFGYLAAQAVRRQPLSNILLQLDLSIVGYQVAVVAMLINLVLNFGLFFFCARESLDSFIFGRQSAALVPISDVDAVSVNQEPPKSGGGAELPAPGFEESSAVERRAKVLRFVRVAAESLLILGVALIMALFIQQADLKSIAGVAGATLCMVICFILPAVFYVRAWAAPTCTFRHVVSVHGVGGFMIVCGVGIGIGCTISVIHGLFLY
jgi:hypothetical protein